MADDIANLTPAAFSLQHVEALFARSPVMLLTSDPQADATLLVRELAWFARTRERTAYCYGGPMFDLVPAWLFGMTCAREWNPDQSAAERSRIFAEWLQREHAFRGPQASLLLVRPQEDWVGSSLVESLTALQEKSNARSMYVDGAERVTTTRDAERLTQELEALQTWAREKKVQVLLHPGDAQDPFIWHLAARQSSVTVLQLQETQHDAWKGDAAQLFVLETETAERLFSVPCSSGGESFFLGSKALEQRRALIGSAKRKKKKASAKETASLLRCPSHLFVHPLQPGKLSLVAAGSVFVGHTLARQLALIHASAVLGMSALFAPREELGMVSLPGKQALCSRVIRSGSKTVLLHALSHTATERQLSFWQDALKGLPSSLPVVVIDWTQEGAYGTPAGEELLQLAQQLAQTQQVHVVVVMATASVCSADAPLPSTWDWIVPLALQQELSLQHIWGMSDRKPSEPVELGEKLYARLRIYIKDGVPQNTHGDYRVRWDGPRDCWLFRHGALYCFGSVSNVKKALSKAQSATIGTKKRTAPWYVMKQTDPLYCESLMLAPPRAKEISVLLCRDDEYGRAFLVQRTLKQVMNFGCLIGLGPQLERERGSSLGKWQAGKPVGYKKKRLLWFSLPGREAKSVEEWFLALQRAVQELKRTPQLLSLDASGVLRGRRMTASSLQEFVQRLSQYAISWQSHITVLLPLSPQSATTHSPTYAALFGRRGLYRFVEPLVENACGLVMDAATDRPNEARLTLYKFDHQFPTGIDVPLMWSAFKGCFFLHGKSWLPKWFRSEVFKAEAAEAAANAD